MNSTEEEAMLKQFNAGSRNYGFIEGPDGYIVTESDFCHEVRSLNENIELRVRFPWESENEPEDTPASRPFRVFTIDEIRAIASPVISFREWAHYWGIKDRVARNYASLIVSMGEIGASIKLMPKWGEDIATVKQ